MCFDPDSAGAENLISVHAARLCSVLEIPHPLLAGFDCCGRGSIEPNGDSPKGLRIE